MPAVAHPAGGPLNLACHLPWYTKLPDLGPKGYIAFGRWVGPATVGVRMRLTAPLRDLRVPLPPNPL